MHGSPNTKQRLIYGGHAWHCPRHLTEVNMNFLYTERSHSEASLNMQKSSHHNWETAEPIVYKIKGFKKANAAGSDRIINELC